MAASEKIFGIGFQKTGTASLAKALRILGFRVTHGMVINGPKGVEIEPPVTTAKVLPFALAGARQVDAVCDSPWPTLYRELDAEFPGSKFILTLRDPKEWIKSTLRHFGARESDALQWIYGVPCVKGNETRCLEVYQAHNAAVREHFAVRPSGFLEIDFGEEEGWEKLCAFLGRPVPDTGFPRDNTWEERERKRASAWRQFKAAIRNAFAA